MAFTIVLCLTSSSSDPRGRRDVYDPCADDLCLPRRFFVAPFFITRLAAREEAAHVDAQEKLSDLSDFIMQHLRYCTLAARDGQRSAVGCTSRSQI